MVDVTETGVHEEAGVDGAEPEPKKTKRRQPPTREETLRRMLKNVLDNTPPDATPTSVRRAAEALLRG